MALNARLRRNERTELEADLTPYQAPPFFRNWISYAEIELVLSVAADHETTAGAVPVPVFALPTIAMAAALAVGRSFSTTTFTVVDATRPWFVPVTVTW